MSNFEADFYFQKESKNSFWDSLFYVLNKMIEKLQYHFSNSVSNFHDDHSG